LPRAQTPFHFHSPGAKSKPRTDLPRDLKARARAIVAASSPRFIEGERERYDGTTRARRGGLTADEYRRLLIEKSGGD
jgi:hypothetical protein